MKHPDHSSGGPRGDRSENAYYEPISASTYTFEEKKSRFVAELFPFTHSSRLKSYLNGLWTRHPDATHVVHAYVCGHTRPETRGYSDDGEPHGTAGRPVLDALGYARLTNVLVAVVRYFGGTKLGTGGLVRAYGDAARGAIEVAAFRPSVVRVTCEISVPYEIYDVVRASCERAGADIVDEQFAETVSLQLRIEKEHLATLSDDLQELSAGRIRLSAL